MRFSGLVVGQGAKDDAAAFDLGDGRVILSTTDFFLQEYVIEGQQACQQQQQNHPFEAHLGWVVYLLRDYYDPMYDYQLKRYPQQIMMQGSPDELVAFLKS